MSNLFGKPKVQEAPPAPLPRDDSTRINAETRRRIQRRGGRQSTILTAQPAPTLPAGGAGGGTGGGGAGGGGRGGGGGGRGPTTLLRAALQ